MWKIIKIKAGFSLIELLIVAAILAILASVVTLTVGDSLQDARDGERISDLNSIANTLEQYFSDDKEYPPGAACSGAVCYERSTDANFVSELVTGNYLSAKPEDPKNVLADGLYYEYGNPNSSGVADQSRYYVKSLLEDKTTGEDVYRYCNGGVLSDYYYMKFSSYTYRTTHTNEGACGSCSGGVTCYSPQW